MNFRQILISIFTLFICCSTVYVHPTCTLPSLSIFAEEGYSGLCGENATYSFDENTNTLTISGYGNMYDYTVTPAPWVNWSKSVTIEHLIIEDGITSIGCYAFENCKCLLEVTIPDSVTSINYNAFANCYSLKSVSMPDSVLYVEKEAFYGCTDLQQIHISQNTTSIGFNAFSYCQSLESIKVPDSVTFIGEGTFWGCTSLIDITIPTSITYISDSMFIDCVSLREVIIPDTVTEIGNRVFENCASLESINVPDSVTYIGEFTFRYDNTTIYGVKDTYAETYASENGLEFVAIEKRSSLEQLTTIDILNLKKFLVGISQGSTNLDFNDDGEVNVLDLITAKNNLI